MKSLHSLLFFSMFILGNGLANVQAQQTPSTVLNRPLHNISYLSANARFGYGLGKPLLTEQNNWKVNAGGVTLFGAGINYVRKNNFGFDLQINGERGQFTIGNEGPEFTTNYFTLGAELGVKKVLPTKPDDTFFIRAGLGYNFLVKANASGTNDYYSFSTASNGNNLYVMPEVGYQFRFASGRHLVDVSVCYQYSLTSVGSTSMTYYDKGNLYETNTADLSGTFFGFMTRYSFMFKGFEKNERLDRKVDSVF